MAYGVTYQRAVSWLVVGLIASTRSQPVTVDALQRQGVQVESVPAGDSLHSLGIADSHIETIANTLEHVFRQGKQLQVQVAEVTGRQTAASLATSLGSLIRPAITAFVGALTMNSATSITNAITALLGGRSLDVIPAETFMTAPTGREGSVLQPTRESAEEMLKRRPSKRKQRHPSSAPYNHAH